MSDESNNSKNHIDDTELPINEHEVKTVSELEGAVDEITRLLGIKLVWRGQEQINWTLVPRLYREGLSKDEITRNCIFQHKAPIRYPNCPDDKDFLAWLFLMQHYGMPTRLLDWSLSPLVALYFAVEQENHDNSDAVIWALCALKLAREQGIKPGNSAAPIIDRLAQKAFDTGAPKSNSEILPVTARESDLRHIMQQASFTIHACGTPLETLPSAGQFLARIRIPSDRKAFLKTTLEQLGVSRLTLFPDLENLAKEVSKKGFIAGLPRESHWVRIPPGPAMIG